MQIKIILFVTMLGLPGQALWADSIYCPQNHGYINVGMSMEQVVSACGQPLSKQDSNIPATQKVPVQQLIYVNAGTHTGTNTMWNTPHNTAFYGYWNIPLGTQGVRLEIDIMNNKVAGMRVNGSNSNASSLCPGTNIQVGDPASKVYFACGSPSTVNQTFINQIIPGTGKPQVWLYQMNQYQAPVSLTFVNGKLQSIN